MQRYERYGWTNPWTWGDEWVKYADVYAEISKVREARERMIDSAVQREREEIIDAIRTSGKLVEWQGICEYIRSRSAPHIVHNPCLCEDCRKKGNPKKIERIPMIEAWTPEGHKVINALNELIDRENERG